MAEPVSELSEAVERLELYMAGADYVNPGQVHIADIRTLLDSWRQQAEVIEAASEQIQDTNEQVKRLKAELAEALAWKEDEQTFLKSAGAKVLNAGFKGDSLIDGIAWVCAQLAAANERLRQIAETCEWNAVAPGTEEEQRRWRLVAESCRN